MKKEELIICLAKKQIPYIGIDITAFSNLLVSDNRYFFDIATQRDLLRKGFMGSIWSSKIFVNKKFEENKIYISFSDIGDSLSKEFIPLEVENLDVELDFKNYYERYKRLTAFV